jgi:aromatic ring-opening dioxygenase catalytic subunit (LigB family)
MGEIVFAAGIPHAPAYVGLLDKAPAADQEVITRSYAELRRQLQHAKPDVMIVFANDHLTNSRIRQYPDFLIGGASRHSGPHEWFKPWIACRDYTVQGNPTVAKALFRGMTKRDVRMELSDKPLNFDDNISVPVVMTDFDELGIDLVPVMQNCTVPPYPDGLRCYEIGVQLASLIRDDLPKSMRVALLGSGGLSHEPGGEKYFKIDEEFDRHFIDLCVQGAHDQLLDEMTPDRMEAVGMGGTPELYAWFPVMAAIGKCAGETFGYSGCRMLRCGFGAVIWDLKTRRH